MGEKAYNKKGNRVKWLKGLFVQIPIIKANLPLFRVFIKTVCPARTT